ncbi:wax ester/triacylglycerol synthase domain-containing protein [Microtetraspora fusca]|uniref:diacylglycerol O-acyltransferase n=1 Tax=Microtetraspora fusca TaxID=1997 RepID=A0ABW6V9U4_MICFU
MGILYRFGARERPDPDTAGSIRAGRIDHAMLMESRTAPDESLWHIGVALRMPGPPPGRPGMRQLLGHLVDHAPALTYRPAIRGRDMRWEPDRDFQLDRHLDYHRLPTGCDEATAVLEGLRRPVPPDHPLWSVLVLHGHRDDEHILCYRAHHAFHDGISIMSIFQGLLTGRPLPRPVSVDPPHIVRMAAQLPAAMPELLRLLAPRARWHDRVAPYGRGRRLYVTSLDGALVQQIAAATGATLGQINLAVLSGALRAWAPHHWEPSLIRPRRRGLTTWIPVNLAEPDHSALGNRVGLIAVTLPCSDPSPLSRLNRVMAQIHDDRVDRTRRRQRLFDLLPYSLIRISRSVARWGSRNRLIVTMLSAVDNELPGARGMFGIPILPVGVPAMVAFLALGHTVSVSLLVDDSVTHAERLAPLLRHALDELAEATRA